MNQVACFLMHLFQRALSTFPHQDCFSLFNIFVCVVLLTFSSMYFLGFFMTSFKLMLFSNPSVINVIYFVSNCMEIELSFLG